VPWLETVTEAFKIIERHTESEFCGWFSNDMILSSDWIDYVFAARRYFAPYRNFSMHFARRDLFVYCREFINPSSVVGPE
jgi:hypothetical protein